MVDALAASSTSPSASSAPNRLSDLSSEQFLKIIFTELQKQDPLSPNDSSKLLEQLSSIRNIQSDIEISNQLKSVVNQNQFSSAGTLIGQHISGLDDQARRVQGQVVSVSSTKSGPVLNLKAGQRVPFSSVDQIQIDPFNANAN